MQRYMTPLRPLLRTIPARPPPSVWPQNPACRLHRRSQSSASISASEGPILLDIQGPKATITLNNPKRGNAFDVDLQLAFIQHMNDLAKDRSVRAIVITGRGKMFCTGKSDFMRFCEELEANGYGWSGMNLSSSGETLAGNNTEQWQRCEFVHCQVRRQMKLSSRQIVNQFFGAVAVSSSSPEA